ncbi:hypothetical protein JRQ81_012294 [Phrynocephalus forsythii]|uniref:Uncharacterized protein n=1 Tax=Phrynocephalus forsythii TaxID=171643 RepID=A0A9Q0X5L4_9SAUR|nr:hypothetical protein JRQ81_012294 [Phrynocephalus forsythii]
MEVGIVPGLTREVLLGRDWPGIEKLAARAEEACAGEEARSRVENLYRHASVASPLTASERITYQSRADMELRGANQEQVRNWQQEGSNFQGVREGMQEEGTVPPGEKGFELRQGVIYLVDRDKGEEKCWMVLPHRLRELELQLAHDISVRTPGG